MGDKFPNAALDKIANLAKVEARTLGAFRRVLNLQLNEARRLHQREAEIISAFPTLKAVDGHLKVIALAAGNLANLLKPSDEAHCHALEQLRLQLLAPERWLIANILSELHRDEPLVAISEILGELAKAISITSSSLQKTKKDPAATAGYTITNVKKHLGARWVIRSLIVASKEMGNKLTFSHPDGDVEGTLIDAITILKGADNFFSPRFFPEKLRKICDDVRRELSDN